MNLTLLQDALATDEPLSVLDVAGFLLIDPNNTQENLTLLISAARLEAENVNGRELAKKQFLLTLDRWPHTSHWANMTTFPQQSIRQYSMYFGPDNISLLAPLISVDSVKYTKSDGTVITMAANTDYIVDKFKFPGVIVPAVDTQWPTDRLWPTSAIQITFTVGMLPAQVPAVVKNAMLLLISEWYSNRLPFSAVRFISEVPFSVRSGFMNDKLWRF